METVPEAASGSNESQKRKPGRPYVAGAGALRYHITLTLQDAHTLRDYGAGSISRGVARLVSMLRGIRESD
jgi:hypothetical protein